MAVDKVDMQNPDDIENTSDCCFHEEFKDLAEVKDLISKLPDIYNDQTKRELSFERITQIVDYYQAQPHLIDPHIELILTDLLKITRSNDSPTELINEAFKYVYLITKMRGYKVIVRFLPHEVADVEPVMALLVKQDPTDFTCWETRYIILLWMSMLCKIPFDLTRLDASGKAGQKEPIMDRIYKLGQSYLTVNDKSRDAAAFMMSQFVTRPDVSKVKLSPFLDWALQTLREADCETMLGINKACGVLSTIALLYKHGKREDVLQYAPKVLDGISECNLKEKENSILRKIAIKVTQRLGLTFLKTQVISWRYNRGNRSLASNLQSNKDDTVVNKQVNTIQDDEGHEDIPESIEEILGELLEGLRDRDTIVRWSAAKGIGRVTGRLPRSLADEVVESVLQLFTLQETDGAWHGGCLAIAELGRRGLLLPERLPTVVPVVLKALAYDERKGNFSVGSHVRDAACYVCWAFARAYEPEEIKPFVNRIANGLIIATIFDREVNVRKAASAAFQENVGRQGIFPHGIDIVTTADYFVVGNRSQCYLEISVYIAQFEEYTESLVNHLVNVKISHWDSAIRELSAEALYNLTATCPQYMIKTALPTILSRTTSIDLFMRHGAVLSAAYITHALYNYALQNKQKIQDILDKTILDELADIASKLQNANLFKGLGGELMRKAVCCLINKLSISKIPVHGKPVVDLWQDIIDDCLLHVEPEVQASAVDALPTMISEYYTREEIILQQKQGEIIKRYLNYLKSSTQTIRCGFSLALGSLPKAMLNGRLRAVLDGLIKTSQIVPGQEAMAESRRDAIKAITSLCKTVGVEENGSCDSVLTKDNIPQIYEAFLAAMLDYTLDSRGDVGAWVREASMSGLLELTILVVNTAPNLITTNICEKMVGCLVQQCCEKIDRTRAHAGNIFYQLLYLAPSVPNIPHKEFLLKVFSQSNFNATGLDQINWAAPSVTFPLFIKLLEVPVYTYRVLVGTCVSVGGLTESLVQNSSQALFHYINSIEKDQSKLKHFCDTLLQIYSDYLKVNRVSIPLLKMTDQLLSRASLDKYLYSEGCTMSVSLCECVKREIQRSADPQKLMASADVFCGLLPFQEARKKVLFQLMVFLCHRYPRVRKTTANKLYEALLMYDDVISDEIIEEVQTTLCDTDWDLPVDQLRPIRNNLCDLMGVNIPVIKGQTAGTS
ncbi:tubulin-specific chaperone D [Patella vulgata]|uniref:tubulin-specific chaperone D n=1 Tax=Patella vulgata TaxID=6465 RepID=UPI00217FCEEA|nr:tubulin-specific chaperone D [Patella vulgata]